MTSEPTDKPEIATALDEARARTLALLDPIAEPDLVRQHSPLMSPLVWDLAHIGHYEELWLLRAIANAAPTDARFDDVYDAFRHPRAERPALDLLGPTEARDFLADVRKRALDVLGDIPFDGDDPLLEAGFVYGMVLRHEHQHDETLLATIDLMADFAHPDAGDGPGTPAPAGTELASEVLVETGPFMMGTDADPWSYDNERPAHVVDLPAFFIDTTPVTNAAFARFVTNGGYDDPTWWSEAGWAWRTESGVTHPGDWIPNVDGWRRHRFGRIEALPAAEPVQHVCWYEADAYARFVGRRLPTEAEWEKAARWDAGEGTGTAPPFPWGEATADHTRAALFGLTARWGPDEVGAHPAGVSPWGALDMLGGVWEWTASDFGGYPGFVPFPYREYSEVFFGPEYKVLRGGSWATHPTAVSATFRNWDFPIRRQIFSGFRCARDA